MKGLELAAMHQMAVIFYKDSVGAESFRRGEYASENYSDHNEDKLKAGEVAIEKCAELIEKWNEREAVFDARQARIPENATVSWYETQEKQG